MLIDLFHSQKDLGKLLTIKVTPKAKHSRIKIEHNPDGSHLIRVYVTVPAEDGKANQAVLELLSKELGIAKSQLQIVKGHTTREKLVKIL